AQEFTGGGDFVVAQRGTVTVVRAGFVRRAETYDGFGADQGWARIGFCRFDRRVDGGGVVAVNRRDHVPAVGFKTLWRVVGEPAFHVTVNRDAVVIPEGDQL